jgi:hypothetical protein
MKVLFRIGPNPHCSVHGQFFRQLHTLFTHASRGQIDDRRMAASDTTESMKLRYTMTVNGKGMG